MICSVAHCRQPSIFIFCYPLLSKKMAGTVVAFATTKPLVMSSMLKPTPAPLSAKQGSFFGPRINRHVASQNMAAQRGRYAVAVVAKATKGNQVQVRPPTRHDCR
jgi:hypothetical protein